LRRDLLIAGSGKMAQNVGLFFLRRGHAVGWLSRSAGGLCELRSRIGKPLRRLARLAPELDLETLASFHLYDACGIPCPYVLIESVSEALQAKQDILVRLRRLFGTNIPVLSNSSSILPDEIHPHCIGVHFFYPLELTELAEVIVPETCPQVTRDKARRLLTQNDIQSIEQDRGTAFAVNRLLLPVHAECFRALAAGYPAAELEEASRSPLVPGGLLSFIDSVGIDVIHAAVRHYLRRMPVEQAVEFAPLEEGLGELLGMEKLGAKNRDGLLRGGPLPWDTTPKDKETLAEIGRRLNGLLINTCCAFLESGQMTCASLDLALRAVFQAECSFREALHGPANSSTCGRLATLYSKTGLSYLAVTKTLRAAGQDT